jgi:hypothetical protein
MSRFLRSLLITAAATGAAAYVLSQIDFEAARAELADHGPEFPGMDPENMQEEDVAMLLNELASQL